MNTPERDLFLEGGNQVYLEIKKVIARASRESDVSNFQIIGALESAKMDILDESRIIRSKEGE